MTQGFPVSFSEKILKSPARGGWMYVVWPESVKFFGTRASIKVQGTMDGHPFKSSFMPLGDGTHKLPVKNALAVVMAKSEGDTIKVEIVGRI